MGSSNSAVRARRDGELALEVSHPLDDKKVVTNCTPKGLVEVGDP